MASSDFPQAQRIIYLISRYNDGSIDFAELQELEQWRRQERSNEALFKELLDEKKQQQAIERMQSYDTAGSLRKIKERIAAENNKTKFSIGKWPKLLMAAAILVCLGLFLILRLKQHPAQTMVDLKPRPTYIAAGSDKAILTLADGKKVLLTKKTTGIIAEQAEIQINNSTDGKLTYSPIGKADNSTMNIAFNTIETPRAGKYELQLPDGTKVWLNAASSLRYPIAFNGKTRDVELTGEAYFEVAKDKTKPFSVTSSGQKVTVLGTHFNINSYTDEAHIATTLVEGSVQVSYGANHALLIPGQQSALSDGQFNITKADIHLATAWKDGQLAFLRTDLKSVLRQISRWYNIDVEYVGKAPNFSISGDVSRDADLSAMLKILELYDVHFVQQGHKLIIIN
jgi:transmembrane sensor